MKSLNQRLLLILLWLVFVVSLALWWMIFSLRLIGQLEKTESSAEFSRQHQMLLMEGTVLIVCLVFGGLALFYYALRERRRFSEIRLFFSSFSHDLKTSIARLVLQGEQISQQTSNSIDFQKNLLSLEMQLENSLFLAQTPWRELLQQEIKLKDIMVRMHTHWPSVKIQLKGKGAVLGDRTAIESIFKNLISNSIMHGEAEDITITCVQQSHQTEIVYSDDARKPFVGNLKSIGQELMSSEKSSGLGVYIIRQWMNLLKGKIEFSLSERNSLVVKMVFPLKGKQSND